MNSEGDYLRKKSQGRIPRSAQDHLLGMLAADK
jgi:hypothetical protein